VVTTVACFNCEYDFLTQLLYILYTYTVMPALKMCASEMKSKTTQDTNNNIQYNVTTRHQVYQHAKNIKLPLTRNAWQSLAYSPPGAP